MEEPGTLPPAASAAAAATATATATATMDAESKKRNQEDDEFQSSKYFKMRAIVKDVHPVFIEVLRAPDFQNSKAAQDIQIKMKIMLELSKELRNELASFGEPAKLPEEQPLAGASKDMGNPQREVTHAPQPLASEFPNASGNATVKASQHEKMPNIAEKESLSGRARNKISGRALEENNRGSKEVGKQREDGLHGTYVVGGSPIGWNFLMYPCGEAVYYGVKKASRRAAK